MAPPSPPQIRRRPKARNGTLQFFWTTPLSNGGSPLTAYVLACTAISYSQTISPTNYTHTVSGLTNGTNYTFTLKARNADGDSAPVTFLTVQPGNFPDPPQDVTVDPLDGQSALINWSAPISTGGADIRFYVAHALNITNPGVSTLKKSIYGNRVTSYFTGLDASSQYLFNFYAVNDPGYSIPVSVYGVPTDPDLVLLLRAFRYSGSGTWYDESGLGHNATLETGTIAKNGAGNGVVLDGITNYTVSPVGVLSTWTLNVWFKETAPPGYGSALITDIYTGSAYINFGIVTNSGGENPYGTWAGFMFSAGGFYVEQGVSGWTAWKNIQITWDGAYMKTYVNGAFVHETNFPGVGSSGTNYGVRLGRRWDGPIDPAYFVTGDLGEVRIYSRALNATEVAAAYMQSASIFL